ncbi:MAG: zf-HC2 domain-containing protein [Betaproteobacteria bacterium]|nr:zf-HC2 domain-containing protein [Betaproteobacteria bacterium]
MLNCRDATQLISENQERSLSLRERLALKLHLMMCSGCQNFKDQIGVIRFIAHRYAKKPRDKNDRIEP